MPFRVEPCSRCGYQEVSAADVAENRERSRWIVALQSVLPHDRRLTCHEITQIDNALRHYRDTGRVPHKEELGC